MMHPLAMEVEAMRGPASLGDEVYPTGGAFRALGLTARSVR